MCGVACVCVITPLPTTALLNDVGDVPENFDITEKQKVTKPSHNTGRRDLEV